MKKLSLRQKVFIKKYLENGGNSTQARTPSTTQQAPTSLISFIPVF